jgi:hypothetical protein
MKGYCIKKEDISPPFPFREYRNGPKTEYYPTIELPVNTAAINASGVLPV